MNAMRLAAAALATASFSALAQVTVTQAWIRGTVPGQTSTGAFMQLRAANDTTLVAVTSPAARTAELHASSHEAGMMRMRAVPAVALPAGKVVALRPGGYHVMLLDLTETLRAGSTVPLTLTFRGSEGETSTQSVSAEVRPLTATGAKP